MHASGSAVKISYNYQAMKFFWHESKNSWGNEGKQQNDIEKGGKWKRVRTKKCTLLGTWEDRCEVNTDRGTMGGTKQKNSKWG